MKKYTYTGLFFSFLFVGCGQKTEEPKAALSIHPIPATVADPSLKANNQQTPSLPLNSVVTDGEFPQAFELIGGRSLKEYHGLDPLKFLELYSSKLKVSKGEFETTAEFQKRKSNTEALLAPISQKVLYAFKLGGFFVEYDADSKSYRSNYSCNIPYGTSSMLCPLAVENIENSKYAAQNGYGANVNFNRKSAMLIKLEIKKNSLFIKNPKMSADYRFIDLKYPVSVDSVQSMKHDRLSMLVVGNVGSSGVSTEGSSYKAPTRDDPSEISVTVASIPFTLKKAIFYNQRTGEILLEKSY